MTYRTLTLMIAVLAAPLGEAAAQQAGVTRLPDSVVAGIDRTFSKVAPPGAPGCAVGVSQRGQPVLTRAYGMANLEYGVRNTPETIFESGSVAKQFTAAAVVLLAQDGKLSLDDDVRKYLPEVPIFVRPITIRNLLTHTSGLRDQWGLLEIAGRGPGTQVHTLSTILDLVSHQKALNFQAGSEYLYSNTGYALAAIIVQRVSGKSFARFSNERLFRPLGMTNTQWRDDFTRIVKNRATAYERDSLGEYHQDMPFTNVHGNGGLLTTLADLLKWNAFLDAPAALPGGPALVQALETPMVLTNGRPITYALGLTVTSKDGIREVTHSGSTAGYRTWLARFPDQKLSVAVLCNLANVNPTALGTATSNLLLRRQPTITQAAPTPAGAPVLSAAQLERYAGIFVSFSTQALIHTVVRDGKLMTEAPAARVLTPIAPDRFRVSDQGELSYRFVEGRLMDVTFASRTDSTIYDIVSPAQPDWHALSMYVGTFLNDELEQRLSVEVRDTVLVIRRRPADVITMRPIFRDAFEAPEIGTVVFTRDSMGAVTGFGIWAGRVRNVRFAKEVKLAPGLPPSPAP